MLNIAHSLTDAMPTFIQLHLWSVDTKYTAIID